MVMNNDKRDDTEEEPGAVWHDGLEDDEEDDKEEDEDDESDDGW